MVEQLPAKQQAQILSSQALAPLAAGPFQLYFNGFALLGGATDATIVLQNGAQTVTTVQAGYSVLKELVVGLTEIIKANEEQLGIVHPRLVDVLEKLKAEEGNGETT